jgi:hypothetical protein
VRSDDVVEHPAQRGIRRACAGAAVVYHCAQPGYTKWVELFPPLTRAVLDGTADADANRIGGGVSFGVCGRRR